ncbi:MAG: hypothetical protein U0324_37180 [Polyangiales bacterium]
MRFDAYTAKRPYLRSRACCGPFGAFATPLLNLRERDRVFSLTLGSAHLRAGAAKFASELLLAELARLALALDLRVASLDLALECFALDRLFRGPCPLPWLAAWLRSATCGISFVVPGCARARDFGAAAVPQGLDHPGCATENPSWADA